MKYKAHNYQQVAEQWVIDKPRCGLFLDMGFGKTVITLTAVQRLIDDCDVKKTLVVAPLKVAETTWSTEADKWDHLANVRVVKVLGSEKKRIEALHADADVYVINRENYVWLVAYYKGRLPFDMLVIDELTSFKSPKSLRFKAMRASAVSFDRVVGLTGTPAPNGLLDLWGQMYCLDQGERLGKFVTRYRDKYFETRMWNNIPVKCTPKKGAQEEIRRKISDICISMQAKDYLSLPELIIHTERIYMGEKAAKAYEQFERDKVMEFQAEHATEDGRVLAQSAASLMNKLSQFANGAVYDDDRTAHEVHSAKIDKLTEIVESANGSSVLVFYQYKHDVPRILKALNGYRVRVYDGEKDLLDWNDGEIDVLLAHPSSTAYGLNMQKGGHYIAWFGTGWNLELYQQANARLHRQGQQHPVIVYNLVCAGTVDERMVAALSSKSNVQQAILDNLKYLTAKYEKN